jgi:hypothetical protein
VTTRWSILVLHHPGRVALLERLMRVLMPQVDGLDDVEVMVSSFNPLLPVGENREQMRLRSVGRYLNFIDDDDLVSEDYVPCIYPLLDGVVDYVGFNLEQTFADAPQVGLIEKHSLRYHGVYYDGSGAYDGHFRDISHLNPMKRELALAVPMHGWPSEDSRWAEELRDRKIVKTEHYVDRVLYHYITRTHKPELEGLHA